MSGAPTVTFRKNPSPPPQALNESRMPVDCGVSGSTCPELQSVGSHYVGVARTHSPDDSDIKTA